MSFGPPECLGLLAVIAGLAIPIFLITKGLTIIGEGQVAVVERRGRFARILQPGQHLLMPGIESIRQFVPLQEFIYESGKQGLLTKNLAQLQINVIVHFHIARTQVTEDKKRWHRIDLDAVYHAVYSAENWQEATHSATRSTLAETFSLLDLKTDIFEVPDWQDQVAIMLRNRLNDKTRRWGVQITDVAFSGVEFPDNVKDSLSAAGRLQREAYLREIEAASFKETAQTLGLTPVEMLNWRYVEVLRSLLTSNLPPEVTAALVGRMPSDMSVDDENSTTHLNTAP
jgi:regulator of protease activity HflC (stomatin/prohibitin superfamily)